MDILNSLTKVFQNKAQGQTNTNSQQQQLLANQMVSQEKITALLNSSTQSLMCGPECQRSKISGELEQKYLDAQTKIHTAPIELENTKKNYYVYTKGEPYYDNLLEKELKDKVEKMAVLITESFNEEVDNAQTMNKYLNTSIINSRNSIELLANLEAKNSSLEASLEYKNSDILTNDRKTYYEKNAVNHLKDWYRLWWYMYYILALVVSMSLFLVSNNWSFIFKVIIILILYSFPTLLHFFITYLYQLTKRIVMQFPVNIYSRL